MKRSKFWEPINPGWFLYGHLETLKEKHPNANIVIRTESGFPLCGFVASWPTHRVTYMTDDEKCLIDNDEYPLLGFSTRDFHRECSYES